MALTYPNLAYLSFKQGSWTTAKGIFPLKGRNLMQRIGSTYVYGVVVVVAKPIILNICADMFLL
jgi:hypothetical protein